MEVHGVVKLFLNGKEILEKENTLFSSMYKRINYLQLGMDGAGLAERTGTLQVPQVTDSVGGTFYLPGSTGTSNSIMWSKGSTSWTTSKTLNYLNLTVKQGTDIATISQVYVAPLTIPAGFTFAVEWYTTFTGSDYTPTCLSSIAWHIVNSTLNSLFKPNTIGIVHSGGTVKTTITEYIYEDYNIGVYKGSILGGAYTSIGSIEVFREATKYSSKAITTFNKPSDVELYVDVRNTITD